MNNAFIDGLVSVIIPTYNVENFITETISCVLNQTYKNIEIIIIDDHSTDNTFNILEKITNQHNNIICMRQEKNKGAAEARNRGILEAKGRFIAFLDSDDFWESNKIEIQIDDIIKNNIAFSYTTYDFVDLKGKKIKNKIRIRRILTYENVLTKTMISTPTVIYDRLFFGNLLMPLRRTGQDYAFWLLLLRKTNAYGIDIPLVHVRKRPSSLSKNKIQNIKDVWEVQTINEHIPKFLVFFHIIGYCLYALKKHYHK